MDKHIISRLPLPSEILKGGFTNGFFAVDENGKEVAYPSVTARYFSPIGAIKLYEHLYGGEVVELNKCLLMLLENYNKYLNFLLGATGYKNSILMMRKAEKLARLTKSNRTIPWYNPRGKFMNLPLWKMAGWFYRIVYGSKDIFHSVPLYFSADESRNPPYKHYPRIFSPPPFVFRIQATSPIWKATIWGDKWKLVAIADDSWWSTADISIKNEYQPSIATFIEIMKPHITPVNFMKGGDV